MYCKSKQYHFTGSNLFRQWYGCNENIVQDFIGLNDDENPNSEFHVSRARLIHIGWSHNIFQYRRQFYITGDYRSTGQCLERLDLPEECQGCSELIIVSDDYRLVLVDKEKCMVWCINLESKHVTRFNLTAEVPDEPNEKKPRIDRRIVKCAIANNITLFLSSDGLVYSGLPPTLIDTSQCDGRPIDIDCGNEHCILLTDTGKVGAWGKGRRLQLGHGDIYSQDAPKQVEALNETNIVKVAAGGWHNLALNELGEVFVWGWNNEGQLGIQKNPLDDADSLILPMWLNININNINPEDGFPSSGNVKDIACGSLHSAILLKDNSVWTAGNNKYGQLGFSSEKHPNITCFKKCCTFNNVSNIMCGYWSTVVLKRNDKRTHAP